MEELIKYWNRLDLSSKPYVHPDDKKIHDYSYRPSTTEEYVSSHEFWESTGLFHTNLLPMPYAGSLRDAKIFLLLLNPGLSLADYYAEATSKEFVADLTRNIIQDNTDLAYPFLFLNPKHLSHPGGQYWFKKLKPYIADISKAQNMSYVNALSYVSKRIAILELVPYHSKIFKSSKSTKNLESVMQMKEFIKRYLLPKVRANEACIICTRKAKEWDLSKGDNIVIFEGSETRAAHLSNDKVKLLIRRFLRN